MAVGGSARSRHVPPLAWATGAALLARAAVYPPIDLAHGLASDYDRIDLAFYSPLCLLLGLGALTVARDLPPAAIPGARVTSWLAPARNVRMTLAHATSAPARHLSRARLRWRSMR